MFRLRRRSESFMKYTLRTRRGGVSYFSKFSGKCFVLRLMLCVIDVFCEQKKGVCSFSLRSPSCVFEMRGTGVRSEVSVLGFWPHVFFCSRDMSTGPNSTARSFGIVLASPKTRLSTMWRHSSPYLSFPVCYTALCGAW